MAYSIEEQFQYMKIINFKPLSVEELTASSSSIPSSTPSSVSSTSSSIPSSSINPSNFQNQTLRPRSQNQKLITDYFKPIKPTNSFENTIKSKNIKQTDITNFFKTS